MKHLFGFSWLRYKKTKNQDQVTTLHSDKSLKAQQDESRINYSDTLIHALKHDHQQLVEHFSQLHFLITQAKYKQIPQQLKIFKMSLDVHLITENVRFYCYLEQNLRDHPTELETMKEFRREMNIIARAVVQFTKKWQNTELSLENEAMFLDEYDEIGNVLLTRIQHEEESLYTLYTP